MEWNLKKFNELSTYELYSILKARTDVFVVEQECPYHECDGKDDKCFHLYAVEGENTVAYLRILPPGVSFAEASIGRVLVRKEYRGMGLAREMMTKAIEFIENELKENRIKISAQQYLVGFYSSLNFKIASEGYLDDGIPHIDMIYD